RAHAAIAGVAAAALDSELPRLEIDFVVHDDQALGGNLVVTEYRRDTFAAQIVKGLRLHQNRDVRADSGLAKNSLELAPVEFGAAAFGQAVDRHEADIVARSGILFSRFVQARHYPARLE